MVLTKKVFFFSFFSTKLETDPLTKLFADCDKRDSLYVDLPKDIVMHLVDLFFEHLNSVFPIVHRATLKQAIEDGTVSKPLLWSVLAIGAR